MCRGTGEGDLLRLFQNCPEGEQGFALSQELCGHQLTSGQSSRMADMGPCSRQLLELMVCSLGVCFPYRKQRSSFNPLFPLLCLL